ncbi:homocysteine S-methyltransferase family protein [Sulfitobacter sp. JB4-11]|uniref:homocysteine S-methyltransferase family protein n=1 Tax=Sulfitobacter rhodophyticola TaxID=3238304 RepID=UPI00351564ED
MTAITLLDGGMGQELVHRSTAAPTALWSTQIMMDDPALVQAVHADFFDAGATVGTSNTYAIHHDRLGRAEKTDSFADLHGAARDLLVAAADGRAVRRALAIGPLGASYRPDLLPPHDKAVALFSEVARLHADWCDLVICETVVSLDHARAVRDGAAVAGKPVWLAFSVNDQDGTRLRSGEALADILPLLAEGGVDAVLLNCSTPEAIGAGLPMLAQSGLPFGAYANGFTGITDGFLQDAPTVDALSARRDLTPDAYADHVMAWIDQGATIVGGCCEVSPAHIAEIARRLRAAGHTLV